MICRINHEQLWDPSVTAKVDVNIKKQKVLFLVLKKRVKDSFDDMQNQPRAGPQLQAVARGSVRYRKPPGSCTLFRTVQPKRLSRSSKVQHRFTLWPPHPICKCTSYQVGSHKLSLLTTKENRNNIPHAYTAPPDPFPCSYGALTLLSLQNYSVPPNKSTEVNAIRTAPKLRLTIMGRAFLSRCIRYASCQFGLFYNALKSSFLIKAFSVRGKSQIGNKSFDDPNSDNDRLRLSLHYENASKNNSIMKVNKISE
ncbi:hypothetical protein BY458DRAFT_487448 [Sporodiniella umbellata]|nr:hypothetical protein BY458DRAFT_487448 [Sporodiniella umbellata]